MTPARRQKIIRIIFILGIAMGGGVLGRFYFLNQSLPSLLLGRKPGGLSAGSVLVHPLPVAVTHQETLVASQTLSPTPIKIKFDILGAWKFIEGKTSIPQAVKKLDGKWIEVTGFIMPINETQHITRFILIQSLWGCCFGQTPDVNHIIVVHMEHGKTIEFYSDPVRVIGQFSVGETREEGFLVSIYRLEANQVITK